MDRRQCQLLIVGKRSCSSITTLYLFYSHFTIYSHLTINYTASEFSW